MFGWAIRRRRQSCTLLRGICCAFLQGDADALPWSIPSVCVVLAAAGYPEQPRIGDVIAGITEAERSGVTVFQAGTVQRDGMLVTNGGRVLGVTAAAPDLPGAIQRAYGAVEAIRFRGNAVPPGHRGKGIAALVDLHQMSS